MLSQEEQIFRDRLIAAASNNDVSTIRDIVSQLGERATVVVNAAGRFGSTALICAAVNGHTDAVQALLAVRDINVNVANEYGDTALILAATKGHTAAVQALLAIRDINLDVQNNANRTAAGEAERRIDRRPAYREIYNLITTAMRAIPDEKERRAARLRMFDQALSAPNPNVSPAAQAARAAEEDEMVVDRRLQITQ